MRLTRFRAALLAVLLLAGCQTTPPPAPPSAPAAPPAPHHPPPQPSPPPEAAQPAVPPHPVLEGAGWEALPGWSEDDPAQAWDAFLTGCGALRGKPEWQRVCDAATALTDRTPEVLRAFFERNFRPWHVYNPDGSDTGTITGYYEPLLHGSRTPGPRYRYPVYGVPDDLLIVDLGELYPELKSMRLRGRLDGRRVVPYYSRAQIEDGKAPTAGKEILWVDDAVELFFLEIQGSGRVAMDDGSTARVGYADQNGQPYRSIGKLLVNRGELPLAKASMQGIRAWAQRNPDKLREILDYNTSYVFFREMPADAPGPLGSLGVALTAQRSLAVDARFLPLGAPVYLDTTWPNTKKPLRRLMMAQDTGGAIRGAVRADFFWGFGEEATTQAGRMNQRGTMWVLLPADYPPAALPVPPAPAPNKP